MLKRLCISLLLLENCVIAHGGQVGITSTKPSTQQSTNITINLNGNATSATPALDLEFSQQKSVVARDIVRRNGSGNFGEDDESPLFIKRLSEQELDDVISGIFKKLHKPEIMALATALHPRCGQKSPAHVLTQDQNAVALKTIFNLLIPTFGR